MPFRVLIMSGVVVAATVLTLIAVPSWAAEDSIQSAKALIQYAEKGLVAAKDPKKPELELTIGTVPRSAALGDLEMSMIEK